MGSAFKPISFVLNILTTVLGLAIAGVSAWFFIEIKEIVNLRNSDRYLLNFKLYWPQIVPWMFLIVGVFVIIVSLCGFCGTLHSSKSLLVTYIIFLSMAIIASILSSVAAFVFADNENTNKFMSETIYDAFHEMRDHKYVAAAFGRIEERLRCCGAHGPRDYSRWPSFPGSCCDSSSMESCDLADSRPHDRHGCIDVASEYAKIFIKALAVAAVISAVLGALNLIVAVCLSRSLRKRPRILKNEHETDTLKMAL